MPKPVEIFKPLTSWSFSRYSDYKLCPAKFKYKHLLKLPEPKAPAMERGAALHDQAADYIKGVLGDLPTELASYQEEFDWLRDLYTRRQSMVVVEDNWAFTKTWGITQWNDWINCWLRVKLDAGYLIDEQTKLVVIDWKSGKIRDEMQEEYIEQLELYALSGLLMYPTVQEVATWLGYVDAGVTYPSLDEPMIFHRRQLPDLKARWATRVRPMFADKMFAPRANNKCKWCHYRRENGGPCKF